MKYISHAFVLFTGLFSSAQSFATNCIIDAVFQRMKNGIHIPLT